MAYALDSLMKIRLRREDAARSALTAARLRMSKAKSELDARKEEFRLYEESKEARRDRIYAAILGRRVISGYPPLSQLETACAVTPIASANSS